MTRVYALLARRVAADIVEVQAAGALLVALAILVEAADLPLYDALRAVVDRLPGAWGIVAGALALAGAARATWRLRRERAVLALQAAGVSPWHVIVVAVAISAPIGLLAGHLGRENPSLSTDRWTRGEGGWIRGGVGYPDAPGTPARAISPRSRALERGVASGGAGAAGAWLGLCAPAPAAVPAAAAILVASAVGEGLGDRGVPGAWLAGGGVALAIVGIARSLTRPR
jgi:hypothetical protein